MPRLISFPFRLDGTGAIASVEQDTDAEIEQQLAVATLTRPGERITVPTFGVADPAFARFLTGSLQRHCLDFGPNIQIKEVRAKLTPEDTEEVAIEWNRPDDVREAPLV
jgi:hypothetical protein